MTNKRVEALIKRSTKHGQAGRSGKSPTYLIWKSMIGRCYRPSDSSYKWYGAKGITVSDRWRKFENFFEDMGTAPNGMHIHRRNDAAIYSKETCKWMNEKEHIGLHNQQRGWGARLTKAQLIDRVVALQKELAAEREKVENLHKILGQKRTDLKTSREATNEALRLLAAAQAAIEKKNKSLVHLVASLESSGYKLRKQDLDAVIAEPDLSALHQHAAEVRKPLAR